MSIKENVDYVKNELSSEEKFLENFVKGERFFKKYRTLIFTFIAIAILVTIGMLVKQKIEESNKLEANIAFNKFLENADEKELFIIKDKNEKLYEIALFLKAKRENKTSEVNIPMLKELSKFQQSTTNKNLEELNTLSMQNDFLLKEFAIFNKALLLSNDGKYEEAKEALKQIPQTSKASEFANLLNHYLLTK
jgi:predicted negative regulator of RcsB-dependent stress response